MSAFEKRIRENLESMGTPQSEWRAVGISAMVETDTPQGMRAMPEFEFPAGYSPAPSRFAGKGDCCHLCSAEIKNVFWVANDEKKWVMPVGSECVSRFNLGVSGEEEARRTQRAADRALLSGVSEARRDLWTTFSRKVHLGYGRTSKEIGNPAASDLHRSIKELMGATHPVDSPDSAVTRWANKNRDAAVELIARAGGLLERERARREAREQGPGLAR